MARIQRSDLDTDASGNEMVSLRQKDPPSSSSSSSSNTNTNINRYSSGRSIIIYQIIFLVTAMTLVGLWGSKFVAHKNEHQQLRNNDNIIDELGSLEQEQLAKREKEAAASAAASESSASSTNTGNSLEDTAWERMNSIKRAQVENYRSEQALMLNIHATHHGGTAFCARIGPNGINNTISPAFACMRDKTNIMPDPPDCSISNEKSHKDGVDPEFCYSFKGMMKQQMPWTKDQTGPFIDATRPYFHMVSWEFGNPVKNPEFHSMDAPDYEHPNLVSVLATRDPISRLLASGHTAGKKYPGFNKQTLSRTRWWDYAAYDGQKETDNFFLRILTGAIRPKRNAQQQKARNHITEGIDQSTNDIMELFPTGLDESHFEHGKSLMDRFTFVLDLACFDAGMDAMGNLLEMGLPPQNTPSRAAIKAKSGTKALPPKERIGYDDVYEYLVDKNKWDIKLYEYSKTISLINCDELVV